MPGEGLSSWWSPGFCLLVPTSMMQRCGLPWVLGCASWKQHGVLYENCKVRSYRAPGTVPFRASWPQGHLRAAMLQTLQNLCQILVLSGEGWEGDSTVSYHEEKFRTLESQLRWARTTGCCCYWLLGDLPCVSEAVAAQARGPSQDCADSPSPSAVGMPCRSQEPLIAVRKQLPQSQTS